MNLHKVIRDAHFVGQCHANLHHPTQKEAMEYADRVIEMIEKAKANSKEVL